MKKWLTSLITLLFFLLLLICPQTALTGAKTGLLLWFQTVLPTLLPFMIVSNLMVQFGVTDILSSIFYPILGKLLKISKSGCYPLIIGLLSGYPVGAKACADLVRQKKITCQEGQFLLCFCNSASPMFIISFVTASCLHRPAWGYLVLGIVILSGILSGFVYRFTVGRNEEPLLCTAETISSSQTSEIQTPFMVLDSTILNAFVILVKIGGYIILFSILAEILSSVTALPSCIRYFLIGFLEITTGAAALSAAPMIFLKKIILTNFLTAFGGLSSQAQTYSVLIHSGLSIRTYFIFKIVSGCFAALLTFLFICVV